MATANENLDEGGEGYFASVSDLMVGILFIFLLMLTVFALNFRDEEDSQKIARERYEAAVARAERAEERARREEARATEAQREAQIQQDLAAAAQRAAEEQRIRNKDLLAALKKALAQLEEESRGREQARTRLLDELKSSLAARGVQVITVPDAGILRLPEDVLFNVGERTLARDAGPRLKVLADALGATLPCFAGHQAIDGCDSSLGPVLDAVLVEGHADKQRWAAGLDSQEQNDRLSADRALSVFKQLRRDNGALDTLTNATGQVLLAMSAYGDRRPAVAGDTPAAFSQNRRIDLRFLLSSRPSADLQELIENIRRTLQDSF